MGKTTIETIQKGLQSKSIPEFTKKLQNTNKENAKLLKDALNSPLKNSKQEITLFHEIFEKFLSAFESLVMHRSLESLPEYSAVRAKLKNPIENYTSNLEEYLEKMSLLIDYGFELKAKQVEGILSNRPEKITFLYKLIFHASMVTREHKVLDENLVFYYKTATLLLNKTDAEILASDRASMYDFTLAHVLAQFDPVILELLLKKVPSLNTAIESSGLFPIFYALKFKNIKTFNVLIKFPESLEIYNENFDVVGAALHEFPNLVVIGSLVKNRPRIDYHIKYLIKDNLDANVFFVIKKILSSSGILLNYMKLRSISDIEQNILQNKKYIAHVKEYEKTSLLNSIPDLHQKTVGLTEPEVNSDLKKIYFEVTLHDTSTKKEYLCTNLVQLQAALSANITLSDEQIGMLTFYLYDMTSYYNTDKGKETLSTGYLMANQKHLSDIKALFEEHVQKFKIIWAELEKTAVTTSATTITENFIPNQFIVSIRQYYKLVYAPMFTTDASAIIRGCKQTCANIDITQVKASHCHYIMTDFLSAYNTIIQKGNLDKIQSIYLFLLTKLILKHVALPIFAQFDFLEDQVKHRDEFSSLFAHGLKNYYNFITFLEDKKKKDKEYVQLYELLEMIEISLSKAPSYFDQVKKIIALFQQVLSVRVFAIDHAYEKVIQALSDISGYRIQDILLSDSLEDAILSVLYRKKPIEIQLKLLSAIMRVSQQLTLFHHDSYRKTQYLQLLDDAVQKYAAWLSEKTPQKVTLNGYYLVLNISEPEVNRKAITDHLETSCELQTRYLSEQSIGIPYLGMSQENFIKTIQTLEDLDFAGFKKLQPNADGISSSSSSYYSLPYYSEKMKKGKGKQKINTTSNLENNSAPMHPATLNEEKLKDAIKQAYQFDQEVQLVQITGGTAYHDMQFVYWDEKLIIADPATTKSFIEVMQRGNIVATGTGLKRTMTQDENGDTVSTFKIKDSADISPIATPLGRKQIVLDSEAIDVRVFCFRGDIRNHTQEKDIFQRLRIKQ
ncbi:MAG: hypothetical protein WC756_21515 [Taibaiella sp.]|jgi:hypothetical protein